jgi:hypothetical protein
MNITKDTLKRIIKEERQKLLGESERGEYSTGPNYGRGGDSTAASDRRAGGYGDVAKQPETPRYTGANAAAAIMSILKKNGVGGSFEDLNAIAYQIIKSGVVQKITHPND